MDVKTADVVLCEFYFSDLKATKKRPVLVLKDNLPHGDFVGLPISSQLDKLQAGEFEIDNSMFQFGSVKSTILLKPTSLKANGLFSMDKNYLNRHFASFIFANCE